MNNQIVATVIKRTLDTPDVVTIDFTVDGKPMDFTAGQYITVYFDDTDVRQGKAYSISSSPHDPHTSITVKKIGIFSGKLHNLKVGDTFAISSPYGFFNARSDKPIVAIAAGVGIAPIWSIIRYEYSRQRDHLPVSLLYSNKSKADISFRTAIDELSANEPSFLRQYFVTQKTDSECISRRIDIAQDLSGDIDNRNFYVCGSADFVGAMWRQLTRAGVHEHSISTETFFETV